jgi:RimJ/RimL family protein N-acetyltransferase
MPAMLIRGSRTVLRAAVDEDAPTIAALFDDEHAAAAYGPRFPRSVAATLAELRDEKDRSLAIDVDQQLRGYLRASLSWADEVLTVQDFLLDANLVGQGYGGDALGALLQFFFRHWGGRRAELQVRADNPRALRCYQRLGFQIEGRRREVIPRNWGPPGNPDYLLMGLLSAEFKTPHP